jgi:hypothetical protein
MPRTPDRTPGPSVEEEIQLEDNGASPSVDGGVTFNAGVFELRDSSGIFNPRGLTEDDHDGVDQLVHLIAESSFEEYLYTGPRVDQIIVWTDGTKTTKIREQIFSYTGQLVTQIVTNQYDGAGAVAETLTEVYSYTGNKLDDVTRTLS